MKDNFNIDNDCKKLGIQTPLDFYIEQRKALKGCPDEKLNFIEFWELKVKEARLFAQYQIRHKHYDNFSYMYHIEEVVRYARYYAKDGSVEQLIAEIVALLHGIIEDGDVTYNDVKKEFGEFVAECAYRVSDEKGRNRKARKPDSLYEEMKEIVMSTFIKLCDRFSNCKNSKMRKGSMGSTYQKEHKPFKEKLYEKGVLERVWGDLEEFIR